jgi:hypothetical protein
MQGYPHFINTPRISNGLVSHEELVNAVDDGGKFILIAGPALEKRSWVEGDEPTLCYPRGLLKGVVEWCIQKKNIDLRDAKNEFDELFQEDHKRLREGFLTHTGYKIEEYLADKEQLRQCLAEVIHRQDQLEEFQLSLARLPFLGYITTTYDTFIETAYAQVKRKKLPKFYASSIPGAIKAYQEGRPFVLKLFGDIDNADSLIFGRRLANGLSIIRDQGQLRPLLTISSHLFIGFEENDRDLKVFNDIIIGTSYIDRCSISYSLDLGVGEQRYEPEYRYPRENNTSRRTSYEPNQLRGDIGSTTLTKTLLSARDVVDSDLSNTRTLEPERQTKNLPVSECKVQGTPIEVFTAYAQQDRPYFEEIHQILDVLNKKGCNLSCHESEVVKSFEWQSQNYLTTARLILLLVSRFFLNSSFCYTDQMKEVVKKHGKGYYLIPIMVQPAEKLLIGAPFDHLDRIPNDDKGIKAISEWRNKELVYDQIGGYIQEKLEKLKYYVGKR